MSGFLELEEFLHDSAAMDIRLDIELLDNVGHGYTNIFYCDFVSHISKKRKLEGIKSSSYRIQKSEVMEIMKNPLTTTTLKKEPNQSLGYEEDSFIDNKEPFDECLPNDMETLLGGHYVNCGKLQLRKIVLKETEDAYKRKVDQKNQGNEILSVAKVKPLSSSSTKILSGKIKPQISGEVSRKDCLVSNLVIPVAGNAKTSDFKNATCWNISENPSLKKAETQNFATKKGISCFKRIDASSWRISENNALKKVEAYDIARKESFDFKKTDFCCKLSENPDFKINENPALLKIRDNPALKISKNSASRLVENSASKLVENSASKLVENSASKLVENSALPKKRECPVLQIIENPSVKIIENPSVKIIENPSLMKICGNPALIMNETPSLLKIRENPAMKIENPALKIGANPDLKEIKSPCFLKKQTSDYFKKIDASCWTGCDNASLNKIESHGFLNNEIFNFHKVEFCRKNKVTPPVLKRVEPLGFGSKKSCEFKSSCEENPNAKEVELQCYGKTKTSVLKKVRVACLGSKTATSTRKPMEASLDVGNNKTSNLSKIEKRRNRQMELELKKMWVSLPNLVEIAAHARKKTVIIENLPQE